MCNFLRMLNRGRVGFSTITKDRLASTRPPLIYTQIKLESSFNFSNHPHNNVPNKKDKEVIRIGCASGFWGDTPTAVSQLVRKGNLDFLVLDYLSEVTMSLLVGARQKNKDLGWCPDFAHSVGPHLKEMKQQGIKCVTNAGGINSLACMKTMASISKEAGADLKFAVILGDDLQSTKGSITTDQCPNPSTITSVNAYLGAGPISRALDMGADVVICGRCTDSSLVLGPLVHSFDWSWNDYDLLASGSLAGHLIECGAQSTGGICTEWDSVQGWENNGFPIAVCQKNGDITITKSEGTGGMVTRSTVAEQLLYEIGDPACYILPDGICDFSQVVITEQPGDSALVTGARGLGPTPFYKVGGTFQDGWKCTTVCIVIGPRTAEKGLKTANAIITRCRNIFKSMKIPDFTRTHVQIIGSEGGAYGPHARAANLETREAALWLAVQHQDRKALEIFAREIASAGTGMAPGLTAIVGGRPKPSPVLRFFSYLYPKEDLPITIRTSDGDEEIFREPKIDGIPAQSSTPITTAKAAAKGLSPPPASYSHLVSDIAWTRSGDKGDSCNIGVIAKDPAHYPILLESLTEEKVAEYFAHKFAPGKAPTCKRFEVPGIHGLNFILENSLGGGGIASLNCDPQGKGYGQMLLDLRLVKK